jgi:hypothetical protein
LLLRAAAGKQAAVILAKALPDPAAQNSQSRFGFLASLIAALDPLLLEPKMDMLRTLVRERSPAAVTAFGHMGPKAAAAIPELEAWRGADKVDPKQAAALDAALARIRER